MAIADPQYRKGYIKGVKLVRIQTLESDGDNPVTPVYYKIETPQSVAIEQETEEGASSVLRGGDMVLCRVEEVDTIVGATITLVNAKLDAEALLHLCAGTLIEDTIETVDYNIGWEMPTIEEQQSRVPVLIEIYAKNFNSSGNHDSYVKHTLGWCIGYAPGASMADTEWMTPEITIKCSENGVQSLPVMKWEFVDALPA
jgi:hypothetical protein